MPPRLTPLLAEARALLRLAWPVTLTSLNWTLMHLIDVAVIGHAGTAELGALAAARAVLYVVVVGGIAAMTGVLVFVAQADGAGRPEQGGTVLRAGLLHGLAIGGVSWLLLAPLAEQAVAAAGVAPALVRPGAAVLRAMAAAFPAQFATSAVAFFLEGASRPRRVTVVNLTILPLNAVLAWVLADGRLGFAPMGAVGAAHATAIASWTGLVLIGWAAWTMPDADARGVRQVAGADWRAARRCWPEVARFGAMPALSAALELAGFSVLIALSTRLGDVAAGAFQTVFSLNNLCFAIALGMASAAGVRVGHAVGAEDWDALLPRAGLAAAIAFALATPAALAFALAAPHAVGLFSGDPAVIALAAVLLVRLAWFLPFDGVQSVFLYALRSTGDQVAAGVNGVVAFLLVTGGLGWALVRGGAGSAGLVTAAGVGMVAAALLQGLRLWRVARRLRAEALRRPSRPRS